MAMTVLAELQAALKTKSKDPEALLIAVEKVPDDVWEGLTKKTRAWANDGLTEITASEEEKRKPKIPPLEGLDFSTGGDDGDDKKPVTTANGAAHPAADEEKGAAEAEAEDKAKADETPPTADADKADAAPTRRTRATAAKPETTKPTAAKTDKEYKRVPLWPDCEITVVTTKCPYEAGSKTATYYEGYVNNMTVAQALKQGIPRRQILIDRQAGHITTTAGTPPKKKGKGRAKAATKATTPRKVSAPKATPAAARKSTVVGDIINACSNLTASQLEAVTKGLAELQETDEALRKIVAKLPKLTPVVMARLLSLQDS